VKKYIITTITTSLLALNVYAGEYDFNGVWQAAQKNSLSGKSYAAKLEAMKVAKERAAKHWFPRLYLDSSTYSTNDPAYSFMGKLNQGAIEMSDLMNGMQISNELNNPDTKQYQMHTVGMWMPLYEGGMKNAMHEGKKLEYQATKSEKAYADAQVYAEVAKLYGMYLVANRTQLELGKVAAELNNIMKRYKVGTKKNPLGRSGLLGLRTLRHRVEAENDQLNVLKDAVIKSLDELTGLPQLSLKKMKLQDFVNAHFVSQVNMDSNESHKLKSLKTMAKVAEQHKKAAKAYFLPQVGVFAQSNTYSGDRDTNNSQMVGLSVKWEFFNLSNWGAGEQAGAYARSAQAYAKAIEQQELLKNNSNVGKQQVIQSNLKRLESSLRDFEEQTKINYRLFRNGIINVLQMSEVLNRKVDLIKYLDQANNHYLMTWSQLYINKNKNMQ
jgi:outer membrane protein TolC